MFEFELRQYRNPDCKVPGTRNRRTGTTFPESFTLDYWKEQYYKCLWGQEIASKADNDKDKANLEKLEKHIVSYLLKGGCRNYREWFEDELQRRREASDLSQLHHDSAASQSARRHSAQFTAVASRLRSKNPISGRSPKVLQESIEQSLRRRRNFIFHINSPTDYSIEPVPTSSGPLNPQAELKTILAKEGTSSSEAHTVAFEEFQSIIEGNQTIYFDPQTEKLVEEEEKRQIQRVLDSGIGSVVQGYYSYGVSDQEQLSSPGETTAAETDSDSETHATETSRKGKRNLKGTFQTTSGEPGDPDSSPSDSSDENGGPDRRDDPGDNPGGDPGDNPGGDLGDNPGGDPGDNRGGEPARELGGGQGPSGGGNNPPPNPTPPDPPPSGNTTMASQATHLSTHEALYDRLADIMAVGTDHRDGTLLIDVTSAEVYVKELERMQSKIEELAIGCYIHFIEDRSVDLDQNRRYLALQKQGELTNKHHRVPTYMIDISKSLSNNVTGTRLKTPKIAVPKFTGLHRDWPTFKSEFNTLVKNNPTYSSAEKLRLLIEALAEGEAKENISDLTVTDGNWLIAWQRIEGRYDSPRETVHAAIRPLLELPALMSQSESGLHKLISTVRTTKAQLSQVKLGMVSEADVLYLHFIMARLDTKTIKELNQTLTSNDVPSLKTCIDFLERQAKNVGLTKEIKSNSAAAGPAKSKIGKDHKDRKVLAVTSESEAGYSSDESGRQVRFEKRRARNTTRRKSKSPAPRRKSVLITNKSKPGKSRGRSSSRESSTKDQKTTVKFSFRPCSYCGKSDHRISKCSSFGGMSVGQRRDWVRSNKRCYNCLGTHQVSECTVERTCFVCRKKHHTMLHSEGTEARRTTNVNVVLHQSSMHEHTGLLPTAIVMIPLKSTTTEARCLLDTGAQENFITQELVHKLRLPTARVNEEFVTAGGKGLAVQGQTTFRICSVGNEIQAFKINAYILDNITSDLPHQEIDVSTYDHLKNLELADPAYYQPGRIDILLGVTVVARIMHERKAKVGRKGSPNAYYTDFGWIVMGSVSASGPRSIMAVYSPNPPLECTMERFWAIEELPSSKSPMTKDEQYVLDHYDQHTIILPNGQYQVRLPFIENHPPLGHSKQMAIRRWIAVERRLAKDPTLLQSYLGQLKEYVDMGQMQQISETDLDEYPGRHYCVPHHAVFKEDSTSTKVRVVFDASAKTSNGLSLNDILFPGPTVQTSLLDHLLLFRLGPIAILADIEKMFRFVRVDPIDAMYFVVVWRETPKDPITFWKILIAIFGSRSSPILAILTLLRLAKDNMDNFPKAAAAILRNFYMDDFMKSMDSAAEASHLIQELIDLLATAKFSLRKWSSNSEEVLASLPPEMRETRVPLDIDETSTIKTLGLKWNPATDLFQFTLNFDMERRHTKRTLLSDISKIYDTLGWLSPTIIKAKILMQLIWTRNMDWDTELPQDIMSQWLDYEMGKIWGKSPALFE